jgi:hypothetical protein
MSRAFLSEPGVVATGFPKNHRKKAQKAQKRFRVQTLNTSENSRKKAQEAQKIVFASFVHFCGDVFRGPPEGGTSRSILVKLAPYFSN